MYSVLSLNYLYLCCFNYYVMFFVLSFNIYILHFHVLLYP